MLHEMTLVGRSTSRMASVTPCLCRQNLVSTRHFLARSQSHISASSRRARYQNFHSSNKALNNVPPNSSTLPPPSPSSQHAAPSSEPETVVISSRARPRRPLRVYIYAAGFLLLGLGMGQFVRAMVVPPPLPVPETEEDEVFKARIRKDIDGLAIVQELRTQRAGWLEYEAHMTATESERASNMVSGSLAGARGIAVQRIFWNKAEQRLIAVVFVGGAVTGWPGVAHGGGVATLLLENLERVANGPEVYPDVDQDRHSLVHFDINYRKPSQAHRIYLIRAETEDDPAAKGVLRDHIRVKATMEDALTGMVTADATGRCTSSLTTRIEEEAASIWSGLTKLVSWS